MHPQIKLLASGGEDDFVTQTCPVASHDGFKPRTRIKLLASDGEDNFVIKNSWIKLVGLIIASLLLASCASGPSRAPASAEDRDISDYEDGANFEPLIDGDDLQVEDLYASRAEYYKRLAENSSDASQKIDDTLSAAEYYIQGQDFENAEQTVADLYYQNLNQVQRDRLTVINAYGAYSRGEHNRAISLLQGIWNRVPEPTATTNDAPQIDDIQLSIQQVDALLLGSFSYQALDDYNSAIAALIQRERSLVGTARSETTRYIWQIINSLSEERRQLIIDSTQDRLVRNRVEQSFGNQIGDVQLAPQQFSQWREEVNNSAKQRVVSEWTINSPRIITVLLPISSKFNTAALALKDGINYQHEQNNSPFRPQLSFYDIGDQPYQATQFYAAALQSGADFIIGPLGMEYANQVNSFTGQRLPTLLLGGDTSLGLMTSRLTLSPEQEGLQVAKRAWRDGHLSAAVLTTESSANQRTVEAFRQAWANLGGKLSGVMTYSPKQFDHSVELKQLFDINQSQYRHGQLSRTLGFKPKFSAYQRADIDFIFMLANNKSGRIVRPQINFFSGSKIPVYASSSIFNGIRDTVENVDLNETRFPVMPWVLQSIDVAPYAGQLNRLFALGSDAYSLAGSYTQLSRDTDLAISGSTGQVSIGADGSTIIEPAWATYRAGEVIPDDTNVGADGAFRLDISPVDSLNRGSRFNRNVKGRYYGANSQRPASRGANSKTYDSSNWDPNKDSPKE